jgi:hypothetical protein
MVWDHRRVVVASLAAAIVLGFVSDLVFAATLRFRPDWFTEPAKLVAGGEPSATLLTWAALADLLGYYLPTVVVALVLWRWLRDLGPLLADTAFIGAIGYVIAGSIAAASLAVAGPSLIRSYAAGGADQGAIAVTFGFLLDVAVRSIWQLIDGVFIAAWMIGTGLLVRARQPRFGGLSIGLGILFLLSAAANALGLGSARDAVLAVIFALWFVWDVWLGLLVWRRKPPLADRPESAAESRGPALADRPSVA